MNDTVDVDAVAESAHVCDLRLRIETTHKRERQLC